MSFEELSPNQRAGMTREYWESLKPEEREALTSDTCIKQGCSNRRWQEAGSFYCQEHARQESKLAYQKGKLEEQG